MILKDYIDEYKFVHDTLEKCYNYFQTAEELLSEYSLGISSCTSTYFAASNANEAARTALANSLAEIVRNTFVNITKLMTLGYEFYGALKILEIHSFKNEKLGQLVSDFIVTSHRSISACNDIIIAQLEGMKKKALLSMLIPALQETIKSYYMLTDMYKQFEYVEQCLLEPLPDEIENDSSYDTLDIQSLIQTEDMGQIASSLCELDKFFEVANRLCDNTSSKNYYLRKVETGSLLTIFYTSVTIVVFTTKLIDFCYPKYMQWKQLYYAGKAEQLKLATNEIEAVKKVLELNPNIENADELLETASVRIFNYFKLNPKFKINGKEYGTQDSIKLIPLNNQTE